MVHEKSKGQYINLLEGKNDITISKEFALHTFDPISIRGNVYIPWALVEVMNSEHRYGSKPWATLGM